jgi:hypothetical protein
VSTRKQSDVSTIDRPYHTHVSVAGPSGLAVNEKSFRPGKHFHLGRGAREGLLDAAKASSVLGATTIIGQALLLRGLVAFVSGTSVALRGHHSQHWRIGSQSMRISKSTPATISHVIREPRPPRTPSPMFACPHGELRGGHAAGSNSDSSFAELSQDQTLPCRSLLRQAKRDPSRLRCSRGHTRNRHLCRRVVLVDITRTAFDPSTLSKLTDKWHL